MPQFCSANRIFAIASIVLAHASVHAASTYQITSLGMGVTPSRISKSGTVVGDYYGSPLAWSDGITQYLNVGAEGYVIGAYDINSSGLIVGGGAGMAAVWQGNQWNLLPEQQPYSLARAVNDSGLIGGKSGGQAAIWRNGQLELLSALPGYAHSEVVDIGGSGAVVGVSDGEGLASWRWENGEAHQLDHGSGVGSLAQGINDQGSIVGHILLESGGWAASRWDGTELLTLSQLPGAFRSSAYGINNSGVAVGSSLFDFFSGPNFSHDEHATLWENDTAINLNNQVLDAEGWLLTHAFSVNDKGQIVGIGWHNGAQSGFLLTPVPEADALLMLGFGLPLVIALRSMPRRGRNQRAG